MTAAVSSGASYILTVVSLLPYLVVRRSWWSERRCNNVTVVPAAYNRDNVPTYRYLSTDTFTLRLQFVSGLSQTHTLQLQFVVSHRQIPCGFNMSS
jgi:hypothetical protein